MELDDINNQDYNYYNGAILIGFNYQDNNDDYLPGIVVDLYLLYKYCKDILKIPKNQISIITDIKKRDDPVAYAIIAGIVESDIIDFIYEIKSYITSYDNLSFYQQIDKVVKSYEESNVINNLLFYYTGHGKDGHLKLPGKKTLSLISLKEILFTNISAETYIFLILDCCHSRNPGLPFYYDEKYDYLNLIDPESVSKNKCLLITSCNIENKTIATKKGSLFTRNLISSLTNKDIRTFRHLSKELPKNTEIYTTFPNMYIIPSWIYGLNNIYINLKENYIEVSL